MPPFLVSRTGGNGLTYSGTRRLEFRTPTTGVRAPVTDAAWIDDVRAMLLVIPESAAFSHATAAQLLGLPLPLADQREIHVTVPPDVARGRRGAVTWHMAPIAGCTIRVKGLPATDAARTWLDLGGRLQLPDLVAVTDRILRRRLCSQLAVPRGIRGAIVLRRALSLADPGSRSPRESILRVHLHLAGLPRPVVNMNVIHPGEWIGCGDLVWPEFRLYVEYDGEHHNDPKQRHQDAQTRNRLSQLGWTVRVVTKTMIRHIDEVVAMLTEDLHANGWTG